MDDATRDEMESRGQSRLDEEEFHGRRPEGWRTIKVDLPLGVAVSLAYHLDQVPHLRGDVEQVEAFANTILAECEIARRRQNGEIE